ncbi:hypothetical protein ACH42_02915 [Endozoicomonas sp. (ex Bugula neritina AB1)]|nr:hypothetical protein ACH42_02915 [Endozoicomonas sp. (ex Bugula neritina AB1)]
MKKRPEILDSEYYLNHGIILQESLHRLTGEFLFDGGLVSMDRLWTAPFALVSHGTESDPILNFGNMSALLLFEQDWDDFVQTPSRLSAEAVAQSERGLFLEEVQKKGFINHYSGVRISSKGKRFRIDNAIVWNLHDRHGNFYGQAAIFRNWRFINS